MSWVGVGVAAVGSVGSFIKGNKAKKDIESLKNQMPTYSENPEVQKQLGLANQLFNSDMPGMRLAEQNINQTQANQMSNAQRSATDVSQLLTTGGMIAGQANKAYTDLSQKNIEDQQRRLANLNAAQQAKIQEQDKVFQSKMGNYQNLTQLTGMQNQIGQQQWGNLTNLGLAGANALNAWYGKSGGGYKGGSGTGKGTTTVTGTEIV